MERKGFLKSILGVVSICILPITETIGKLSVGSPITQKPLTYADWANMSWTRWCIRSCQLTPDAVLDEQPIDLRAYANDRGQDVVPDGIYDCEYEGYRYFADRSSRLVKRNRKGIMVSNGYFMPQPTASTIEKLIEDVKGKAPDDHRYIEVMKWNGTHFILHTGS